MRIEFKLLRIFFPVEEPDNINLIILQELAHIITVVASNDDL